MSDQLYRDLCDVKSHARFQQQKRVKHLSFDLRFVCSVFVVAEATGTNVSFPTPDPWR